MYNGTGLPTPAESGASGYLQSKKILAKKKAAGYGEDVGRGMATSTAGVTRKPNKGILEHERKRQVELRLLVLQDTLIQHGYTESEIAEKIQGAWLKLEVLSV